MVGGGPANPAAPFQNVSAVHNECTESCLTKQGYQAINTRSP